MAVGSGLRALRARVPDARLETAPTGGGFCVLCERAFPGARLETASTGGVSGLRALRARLPHRSHGI